jgi:predicted acetyltransferase
MPTPELDVSPTSDARELARYASIAFRSLGLPSERASGFLERLDASGVRVARHGAEVVGGLALLPMGHWFGGRPVPCVGVTAVGVAAEHRSKGIASKMMRTALEEARKDRVALSSLFPATFPVYRAAGYETAGNRYVYRVPMAALGPGDPQPAVREIGPEGEVTLRSLYAQRAAFLSGAIERSSYFWRRVLDPWGEEAKAYLVEGRDGPEGYVVLAQRGGAGALAPIELTVADAVLRTPAAGRRIVRMLADHRSIATHARFAAGPGDPLLLLAREERLEIVTVQRWMLRIVDLRAALEERGWPPTSRGEIHLDVVDPILPENAKRWVLDVDRGRAAVREGGSGAVRIHVRGLAALYSGFLGAAELRTAGLCDGEDADLARASALFAGPAPWVADFF